MPCLFDEEHPKQLNGKSGSIRSTHITLMNNYFSEIYCSETITHLIELAIDTIKYFRQMSLVYDCVFLFFFKFSRKN